ncbi:MAG: glutamate racemase [Rickettsiales bacterium]|jgi:glutamate racemase|nr:glutamate racemase [Rickettsiales bacterium]
MKIGVFDSGFGGLIIAKALIDKLPMYDFAYLGDTANLPYGSKSDEKVYACAKDCVDWLFRVQDCNIVIIACNTASIAALRRLQREYLPGSFPGRRILGIIVPTVEAVSRAGFKNIGVIATNSTIASGVFGVELEKLDPSISIKSLATPLLVPLIEDGGDAYAPMVLEDYLAPFKKSEALILGCTHYPKYKKLIRRLLPGVHVISQDEILPCKLADYLSRRRDIEEKIGRSGARSFHITDMTANYTDSARALFGEDIKVEKARI